MLLFQLEKVLLLFLSLALFITSLMVSLAYLMQNIASKLTSKLIGVKLAQSRVIDRLYTAAWLFAGVLGIWLSGLKISMLAISAFFAFKGGADLSSRVEYGFHDLSLLKGKSFPKRIIGKAVGVAALPSVFFLIIWKLFQQILSSLASEFLGIRVDTLVLWLWAAGLVFGLLFGVIRSRGEEGILLKGELALILGLRIVGGD